MTITRLRPVAALALLALGLTGRTSGGNQVLKTQDKALVDQFVVDGKTTREQVLKIYGQPSQTSFAANSDKEVWTYRYSHGTPGAQNFIPVVGLMAGSAEVKRKVLTILFGDDGVVIKHSMLENSETFARGISE